MYTIKMDNESYPKGTVFSVADLPVGLENGKTIHVDKETVKAYEEATGKKFKETVEGINGAVISAATAKKKEGDS